MDSLSVIGDQPQRRIQELRDSLDGLVLTAEAVENLLRRMRDGRVSPDQVQRWASFVRRGYVSGRDHGSVRAVNIDYEPSAEDEIVEVVSRLDEIGDAVDGEIGPQEIDAMLHALSARPAAVPVAPT